MKLFKLFKGVGARGAASDVSTLDPRLLADIGLNPVTTRAVPFNSPCAVSNDRV